DGPFEGPLLPTTYTPDSNRAPHRLCHRRRLKLLLHRAQPLALKRQDPIVIGGVWGDPQVVGEANLKAVVGPPEDSRRSIIRLAGRESRYTGNTREWRRRSQGVRQSYSSSKDQHTITVGKKAIALADGVTVSRERELSSGEGADQDQEARLRKMKI